MEFVCGNEKYLLFIIIFNLTLFNGTPMGRIEMVKNWEIRFFLRGHRPISSSALGKVRGSIRLLLY